MEILFTINLFILSMDHIIAGSVALVAPDKATLLYRAMFGITIPSREEYWGIIKPWGALGVFAGFVGILPVIDPVRYEGVIYGLIGLLLMRIFIRLSHMQRALEHFHLSKRRNLFHVFLIAICVSLMIFQLLV